MKLWLIAFLFIFSRGLFGETPLRPARPDLPPINVGGAIRPDPPPSALREDRGLANPAACGVASIVFSADGVKDEFYLFLSQLPGVAERLVELRVEVWNAQKTNLLFERVERVTLREDLVTQVILSTQFRSEILEPRLSGLPTFVVLQDEENIECVLWNDAFSIIWKSHVGVVTGNGADGGSRAFVNGAGEASPPTGSGLEGGCGSMRFSSPFAWGSGLFLLLMVFPVFLLIRRRGPRKTEE